MQEKCINKHISENNAKTNWTSIYVATALSFVGYVQFSLYFSSMWQYLKIVCFFHIFFCNIDMINVNNKIKICCKIRYVYPNANNF